MILIPPPIQRQRIGFKMAMAGITLTVLIFLVLFLTPAHG